MQTSFVLGDSAPASAAAFFIVFLPSIGSSLPQDSCVFEWDRNAVAARYRARRIVYRRAGCRHACVIGIAVGCARKLTHGLHLHSLRCDTVTAIGIKFDAH